MAEILSRAFYLMSVNIKFMKPHHLLDLLFKGFLNGPKECMIGLALVTFVSKPTYPVGLVTLNVHHLAQVANASFEAGC